MIQSRQHPGPLADVLLLGGEANALSAARELSRLGVRVFAIGEPRSLVRHSRCCKWIDVPPARDPENAWAAFLLGHEAEYLRGAILLPCADAALQLLIKHRASLLMRYRLDDFHPVAQHTMLDKLLTYRAATRVGVATPKYWMINSIDQLDAIRHELVYPLLVKPRLSHLFERRFARKHFLATSEGGVVESLRQALDAETSVLLSEWIPGGDEQLCSYFTYLNAESRPLLHYTKRVIRRYPTSMGAACYHVSDWIPELVAPACRLLAEVGLHGLANVEFKFDPRDQRYKLIECNARLVASNALVAASGAPLVTFVYARLTGRPEPVMPQCGEYRNGMRLWDPLRDILAMRELRRTGNLTFLRWLRSVFHWQRFQYFDWRDPMPAVRRLMRLFLHARGSSDASFADATPQTEVAAMKEAPV